MNNSDLSNEFLQLLFDVAKNRVQKKVLNHMSGGNLILAYLLRNEANDITPGIISNDLHVSTARVATALNMLESKGYIERLVDPSDKRSFLIKYTKAGKKIALLHKDKIMQGINEMFEYLGTNDSEHFIRIFSKMRDFMEDKNMEEKTQC